MLKILKLSIENFIDCFDLLSESEFDFINFNDLGWSKDQFKSQFHKENNFSLGLFNSGQLIATIIGNVISVEKKSEYEILILYVHNKFRKQGCASFLLDAVSNFFNNIELNTIFLEVARNNTSAIKLYEKNNFTKKGTRKNYYRFNDVNIDAIFYEKIINE